MKTLATLLQEITELDAGVVLEHTGSAHQIVHNIVFDSRYVGPGDAFFAIKGTHVDGHAFIDQAINKGARVVICEQLPDILTDEVAYLKVRDAGYALGVFAAVMHGRPSSQLKLVGVTGTNGKTTVATLLYRLFSALGYKTGLLSTVCNRIHEKEIASTHTTPDTLAINKLLAEMVEAGCDYCFMEVSSHAIDQERIAGLTFAGAVFTNITHDHLDYHLTFERYLKAKKRFFDNLPASTFALTNTDDKNGSVMVQNTRAEISKYSIRTMADFKAKIIENQFEGLHLQLDGAELWCRLVGQFNAYNLLAVYATAILLKQQKGEVLQVISNLEPVSGRFNLVRSANGIVAIIDYAHTPDALQNILQTITQIRTGHEQLITVAGCGGDRDKTKRPVMAKIAASFSDRLVLTSDNPRTEDPAVIIEQMKSGLDVMTLKKTLSIVNREEAIKTACTLAGPGDIVVVAGKGHEQYQEINGVKHPFDDRKILENILLK